MSEIYDLINFMKNFIPFKNLISDLMNFQRIKKSKLWTIEILTNNLNTIIDEFIKSDFQKI